jgi:hypothetical protein
MKHININSGTCTNKWKTYTYLYVKYAENSLAVTFYKIQKAAQKPVSYESDIYIYIYVYVCVCKCIHMYSGVTI